MRRIASTLLLALSAAAPAGASATPLGSAAIGPVSVADRAGFTGMLRRASMRPPGGAGVRPGVCFARLRAGSRVLQRPFVVLD